jgi:AraC family transcriptional regulator of adaptative response / DNA-3-methyladenine glycosylase II
MEDGKLEDASLADLAARLGVTDRHMRRVFQQEFGVSPVEYAQTHRLLLAKRLLTDTDLSVMDVAMASGFASLRRFNDLFRTRYRMTPGELRRTAPARAPTESLAFDLAYRPPYDWSAMLAFLKQRAIAGVEAVDGKRYRRTLRSGKVAGWIEVAPSPRRSALRVVASLSLASSLPSVLSRVKSLFDLACHPEEIAAALGPIASAHPGLRLPGAIDGFEIAVRAILGQQVTVKAAAVLAARFAERFGAAIETPHEALDRLFPQPAEIAALEPSRIAELGIFAARARAIVALAREVDRGRLSMEPTAHIESTLAALEKLPGIGPWTAQYIAMRALAWPDAFPHPDVAVLKAMNQPQPKSAVAIAEAWRPWRAYAVLHLWKSLEKAQ